jgi:hypothetical protein
MKMRREAAELFHSDRRTNMTKLIVAFSNFENAPKNLFKHFTRYIQFGKTIFIYQKYN